MFQGPRIDIQPTNTGWLRYLAAASLFTCTLSTAHGNWEQTRFEEHAGAIQHISITGAAEGWLGSYGHPKLRVSCDSSAQGSDLFLSFHFPAEHGFLSNSSRHEPISFKVTGPEQGAAMQETIQYLSTIESQKNVYRTLLATDGMASTPKSGKLLLDLYHGQYLDVHFIELAQPYRVQYDLTGFFESASQLMKSCQMNGFSYSSLRDTWADYISVVEVAGVLQVQLPVYGAAKPAQKHP